MTKDEHRALHVELREALDELLADYLSQHPGHPGVAQITLGQFEEWAYQQTLDPTGGEDQEPRGKSDLIREAAARMGLPVIEVPMGPADPKGHLGMPKWVERGCTCLDCAVCGGQKVVCGVCRMCTRCHQHAPGCPGCPFGED